MLGVPCQYGGLACGDGVLVGMAIQCLLLDVGDHVANPLAILVRRKVSPAGKVGEMAPLLLLEVG